MFHFNPENIIKNIKIIVNHILNADKFSMLFISNNESNVEHWIDAGFNTIYLDTENFDFDLNISKMPDEIWNYNEFYSFLKTLI